ncbi:MAG: TolC family protein [Bacteroidetes bacterium]|nr:TolC family protein [Bacteroidota bacterium]
MRRLITQTTLALILLPFAVNAQTDANKEIKVLSLEDAKAYAVKNNAAAKNARLDVKIQRAKNAEVTGISLPNVSVQGQYSQYLDPFKSFVPGEFVGQPGTFIPVQFTPTYTTNAGATASQILFDGSVMVALQAKKAIVKVIEQGAQLTEEEIRYNVQKAYYGLVIAGKQYNILKSSLQNGRKMANEMHVMQQTGFVEKIEVDRTDVQINNLAADSIRIGGLVTTTEQLLKYSMGMDMAQPLVLSDTTLEMTLADADGLLLQGEDYTDRTDFNMLQSQLRLNQYDLKRHRLSGLPSLSTFISAGYNYAANKFDNLFDFRFYQSSVNWGLGLRMPIFDGMQRYNRVKQAKLAIKKSYNSIEELKLAIDFQTDMSKTNYKNSLIALENKRRNLDLANSVLDLAQKKYKAGVGSNLELTSAQNDMLMAQNNYFSAMLDVINAKSDLQKALGQFK